MTQVNKKGMSFCQKTGSRAQKGNWLIQTMDVLVMFLAVVIPAAYTMGLWQTDILLPIMIAGVYICVMFAILAKFEKQNWYSVLVLVLIFIAVLAGRKLFIEGMADVWNRIGNSWTAATGIAVQDIATGTIAKQNSAGNLLFGAVAGAVLALAGCFVSSYLSFATGMMLPALLLVETVMFNITVPLWIWVLVMVSALYLMISGIWKNSKSAGAILSSCFLCVIIASVIFAVLLICRTDNRLTAVSDDIKADIHQKIYETQYTTLPEGKLYNYRDKTKTAQTALVVTMEEPEQMYLKGFSGAVYENGIWTALDTKLIAENEQLLYWFNTNGFNPKTQFAAAAQLTDFQENTVTVQNISACSEYLYAPFSIADGDYIKAEDINPDSIKGENKRIYTYSVVSGGADSITTTLEKLQKSNEAEVLEYRKNESAYRNFVYENYLQVSQEIVELLGEEWDKTAEKYNSVDNLTPSQAQEVTLQFLGKCFAEDGKAEKIELPLKSAENTSYQYSTVAALTLRYFGIPARYAEGYVISDEMAQKAENGTTITVDSNCARAWVEVYQEGIGWIPMDLTPGFGEFTEEQITESDTQGQSTEGTEETEEENPEDSEDQPDYTGGYMVRVMKTVKKGVSVLLVASILSAMLVYIRRKIILTKKYSLFETDNMNDSTARIYADVADILKAMGYDRGNGSMAALYDDFYYGYGKEYADKFMAATAINSRAIFSSKKLDENHRKQVYEFRKDTLEIMKNNVKWAKRQWIKWGLCLY